jgi:hypothetical protein
MSDGTGNVKPKSSGDHLNTNQGVANNVGNNYHDSSDPSSMEICRKMLPYIKMAASVVAT